MANTILPDPGEVAAKEASVFACNNEKSIEARLDRIVGDVPFIDPQSLLDGIESFHRQRMSMIPDYTTYPEARQWVEHILERDRLFQEKTGIDDRTMAVHRSLGAFLTFRGYAHAKPANQEKCRVAFFPETDQGPMHIKNIDDPITHFRPTQEAPAAPAYLHPLSWDGVGSGLHMDQEPPELFPLPIPEMFPHYCFDVKGAVEFLTRYQYFWGGQNVVIDNRADESVAIDKTSYNYINVYGPGPCGGSHVSGNVIRDKDSAQGVFVTGQRLKYLQQFNQPLSCPDMAFWQACDRAEAMLAELMSSETIRVDEVERLFTTPWPNGLNKDGGKFHDKQASAIEYTLITVYSLHQKKRIVRYQRGLDAVYPEQPEVYQY